MVSRNDANEIFAAGTYHTPSLKPIVDDVQRRSAVKILFGHDRPMIKAGSVEDWTNQSDHGVFHQAGVPFLYFGVDDHADYHQPTDTADKVNPQFFGDVADMIVEAVVTLDRDAVDATKVTKAHKVQARWRLNLRICNRQSSICNPQFAILLRP